MYKETPTPPATNADCQSAAQQIGNLRYAGAVADIHAPIRLVPNRPDQAITPLHSRVGVPLLSGIRMRGVLEVARRVLEAPEDTRIMGRSRRDSAYKRYSNPGADLNSPLGTHTALLEMTPPPDWLFRCGTQAR